MKFLIMKILRTGKMLSINKEINAPNIKKAEIKANKYLRKTYPDSSYRGMCFELLKFVCRVGRYKEIEFRNPFKIPDNK